MRIIKLFCIFSLLSILAACSSNSRYSQKHDSIPERLPQSHELKEPTPRVEPPSRGGNKPYQVFGKHYTVLKSAENYVATGTASWYGNKFHGHLTSNGETYDMYAFSAAHKSLPLPTYLQVTNLANQKKVIVRVNDRGPFHGDRLIDLSYSAAYKLGYLNQGTAKVKIEAITASNIARFTQNNNPSELVAQKAAVNKPAVVAKKASKPQILAAHNSKYIHVLVTRDKRLADNTAKALKFLMQIPVNLTEKNELFRVQLGPIEDAAQAKQHLASLQSQGYPEAYPMRTLK